MKIGSLLLALTAAGVVNFPGGSAVVTPSHGMEHVVVKDARNRAARYLSGTMSSSAFLRAYGGVFTPRIVTRISRMEPHDVFCRNGMAMFAGGTRRQPLAPSGDFEHAILDAWTRPPTSARANCCASSLTRTIARARSRST